MKLTAADLARLSGLLDQGLDLPVSERPAWIDGLAADLAHLKPPLRELLAKEASHETGDLIDRLRAFTILVDPAADTSFHAGDNVGPYRLVRELGRGGMGEVWLAERTDGQLKRPVALKLPMLGLRRSVLVQRFARERDILGSLTHPHIARLYDAGLAADGQPYLALEYIEGKPITAYCDEAGLDARARIALLRQVLDAVQYAHANLVVHRDLKPNNVLVTADGQAMLLDFGIAKLLLEDRGEAGATELTQVGGRPLTPHYAAPEQLAGAPVSIATDVWALGVLLYELMAGQRPFASSTRAELEHEVLQQDPMPPSQHRTGALGSLKRALALDLDTIALKALKKVPAERYTTINAFADDLDRFVRGEPVLARRDSRWYRARKFAARHRVAVGAASAVATIVLGFSAVAIWQAQLARQQTLVAQTEARTAEAVQQFLEGVFGASSGDQPDPVRARQRTARELLDAGAARIDQSLDDAPEAKLRVLDKLAALYTQLGDPDASVPLQLKRPTLAARVHGEGSRQHLKLLAESADMLAQLGRSEEALETIKQVERLLKQHPDPTGEVDLALDMARAVYHNYRADGLGAAEAQRAIDKLRLRAPSKDLVSALRVLGSIHYNRGQFEPARGMLAEALAAAERAGAAGISMRGPVLIDLADAEMRLGQVDSALEHYRAAAEVIEANQGADGRDTVMIAGRYGQALLVDGRLKDALRVLQRAALPVARWDATSDKAESAVLVLANLARALRLYGQPERALQVATQADALATDSARESPVLVALAIYRAQANIDIGRYAEARLALDAGEALVKRHGHAPSLVRNIEHERARSLLAQGQGNEALRLWSRVSAERGTGGATNNALRHADDAEMLVGAGQIEGALSAVQAGLAELRRAPSWGDIVHRERLLSLQARALLQAGRPREAIAPAEQAIESMRARLDEQHSVDLALTACVLSRALAQAGERQRTGRYASLARAIAARHPEIGTPLRHALSEIGRAAR